MKSFELIVGAAQSGKRIDVFLAEAGLPLSRRKIRQVIDVGGVHVNRRRVRIASRQVTRGDRIKVEYNEAALKALKAPPLELRPGDLLLDDGGVLALNKPPGLPSQATRDQSVQHVVPCLAALLKQMGDTRRRSLVLVHRLDKETSGVLLVASGNERATWLTEQFRSRTVRKVYLAVCHGAPPWDEHTERAPLSEIDRKTGNVRAVRAGGRPAVTHFRVLARLAEPALVLVECRPETGRSHQIRVHLELCGLPIVGDKRYGDRRELPPALGDLAASHHLLHAWSLAFRPAPEAPLRTVSAPLPPAFQAFLAAAGLPPGAPDDSSDAPGRRK